MNTPPGSRERRVRVLLCDDHPLAREGVRRMLEGAEDLEVAGEAADGRQAVELATRLRPDVVLMDLTMPEMDGVAATERVLRSSPDSAVVILTTFEGDRHVDRAVRAGAVGYLLKDAPREELRRSVRLAAHGEASLTPALTARLMRRAAAQPKFNSRELEALKLAATGATNREIGKALFIAEATAKDLLESTYRKLGAVNKINAVAVAVDRGLITLSEVPEPEKGSG